MRHNQNRRPQRGRHGGGGGHHHNSGGGQQGNRRVNPRVQTFDSNGPDVRIRGTAFQINEKYVTLARDAASAGDRVLAESYLQHAEHYQRFINEMTEEFNQYQQQQGQQPGQPQGNGHANGQQQQPGQQPAADGLADLDQGFLGARPAAAAPNGDAAAAQPQGTGEQPAVERRPVRAATATE